MRFIEIRKQAEKLGANRFDIAMWKHRERIPIKWQKKIVETGKGKFRFDHFWEIDWNMEKGK